MKIRLCVSILAIVSAVTDTYAVGQSKQPQQGTIVNVQKQDAAPPPARTGADADRTPLQSHSYLYNATVRLNCNVYGRRCERGHDNHPSQVSANTFVPVR